MSINSLYALILAAGQSSRFGSTKQLAQFAGQPLVVRAVRTAELICGRRTLLVAGNDWKNVAEACAPLQGFMVMNPKYSDGLATSLAMGIRTVNDLASGALILLADQPLVTAEHVKLLVDAWEASTDSICAGSYAGTLGPPVIFPARLFPELIALRGDRGAKAVIDANRNSVVTIRLDDAAVDIDRPEDLHQIQQ